jgi:uncharacterized protein (TIGR02679 family)
MSNDADARLRRLLGGDMLAPLRKRLRRHFERAEPSTSSGAVRLGRLSAEEREALASLMGRPPRFSNSMAVDIDAIDTALQRAGIAGSLREALERLDGAIVHAATARSEREARWSAIAVAARHPGLATCLRTPAGLGLLKRLSRQEHVAAAHLREGADAVLQRLPAHGLPRAQLAAETLGDAHALDAGEAMATLVLTAWRMHDSPSEGDIACNPDESRKEERARDIWARAGVLVNELAKPALFLNLPLVGDDFWLGVPGEPSYASLRSLVRTPPAFAVAGRQVYVCENPNLLAIAADGLGRRCAPMVCTDGMPAAAQRILLTELARAGARLLYHGDFDWPGVRIANHVVRAYGAQPWRFGVADYEDAVPHSPSQRQTLAGPSVAASWNAELAPRMQMHGIAIPEEGLAASLLEDLRR